MKLKNFIYLIGLFIVCLFPAFLLAQEAIDPAPLIPAPTSDDLGKLLESLGGLKGASAMGIAAVVVQAIMLFFRSSLGDFAGKYRLLLVYFLSLVSGVLSLKLAGIDFGAAVLHSNTLAAAQVFLNQAVKQFFVKKS